MFVLIFIYMKNGGNFEFFIFFCSYIKLYGLKFSKEDHVKLVKLFIELISVPNLEPSKLNKFCLVIGSLLR